MMGLLKEKQVHRRAKAAVNGAEIAEVVQTRRGVPALTPAQEKLYGNISSNVANGMEVAAARALKYGPRN
jgi:hypothetical protein